MQSILPCGKKIPQSVQFFTFVTIIDWLLIQTEKCWWLFEYVYEYTILASYETDWTSDYKSWFKTQLCPSALINPEKSHMLQCISPRCKKKVDTVSYGCSIAVQGTFKTSI